MALGLSDGIEALRAGNPKQAEQIIRDLIIKQPQNEGLWIWLERCLDDRSMKIDALQSALHINPQNAKARAALDHLLQGHSSTSEVKQSLSSVTHASKSKDVFTSLLDPDQLKAVNHRGSNLLIIAGAGSGKTRTLTYRAISFLKEIEPENLMIVTFTKKAANEISYRIHSSVSGELQKALKKAWIGTIHSICWRMLMENGHLVGLQPNWSVLDQADGMRVMEFCAKPFGFVGDQKIRNLIQLYSYSRNSLTDWHELANTQRFPDAGSSLNIQKAIDSYSRRCRRSNRVDFDDLQVLALRLLLENPAVRQAYQTRFKLIMVDEYQDTNLVQAKLLEQLACASNTITVVGDDAQSIYGFRAATVENILSFEQQFHAQRITIGTNYRSTPEIVALSNVSIRNNHKQIHKDIQAGNPAGEKPKLYLGESPNEEAAYILQKIQSTLKQGKKPENISVLFRATRQVAALELLLKKAGIPYVLVGGEDFFTLEHIKYVLDILRLLVNPEDSIALGSLQQLVGFSSDTVLDTVEQRADLGQLSFWDVAKSFFSSANLEKKSDFQSLLKFQNEITSLKSSLVDGQSITSAISNGINYLSPFIQAKFASKWEEIQSDFEILLSIAVPFTSVSDFLNTVALEQFEQTEEQTEEKPLVLSTIHSAKGLEWETVFVIGLVEFWFPLNFSIQQSGTDEEERRLFYVAATRAKKSLYLTSYTQSLNPYGQMKMQKTSRFIQELPPALYTKVV